MLCPVPRHAQTIRLASRNAGVLLCAAALAAPLLGATALRAETLRRQDLAQTPQRPPREPKREEREQIEALEAEFRKAQLAGDVATMDKLLSEDYLGINSNGELSTKTQQLDHMRNRSLVITQLTPSDIKIKLIGPTAIVNSVVTVEGTLDGVALRGRYRYTRVYQRMPSGLWKITSFEATRIRRPEDQRTP